MKEMTSQVDIIFKLHAFSLLEECFSWVGVTTPNAVMLKWKCLDFESLITV